MRVCRLKLTEQSGYEVCATYGLASRMFPYYERNRILCPDVTKPLFWNSLVATLVWEVTGQTFRLYAITISINLEMIFCPETPSRSALAYLFSFISTYS